MTHTTTPAPTAWPSLPAEAGPPTRDTLHMWTQIVGKIRLAHAPLVNHWWQVPLYVSPRGLTTSAIPYRDRRLRHGVRLPGPRLRIRASDGRAARVTLEPKSVAEFHAETLDALDELGIAATISAAPQ